jgi:hypothetical protein
MDDVQHRRRRLFALTVAGLSLLATATGATAETLLPDSVTAPPITITGIQTTVPALPSSVQTATFTIAGMIANPPLPASLRTDPIVITGTSR